MAESAHPQAEGVTPRGGYEVRDANPRGILIFLLILGALAFVVHGSIIWLYTGLSRGADREDARIQRQEEIKAVRDSRAYFPEPREQISPQLDLATMRARDDAELTNYGWINRTSGVVRIPIERAMDLIAGRGFQTTTNANVSEYGLQKVRVTQGGNQ